jgi:hypothetical protein
MKRIALAVGVLVALWLGALIWAGSPAAGEVVTLTTTDSAGAPQQTPLWIVDRDGVGWLRAGSQDAKWFARLRENPKIQLERAGKTATYKATLAPEAIPETDALMAEKYGLADLVVHWFVPRPRGNSMAVRLDPE